MKVKMANLYIQAIQADKQKEELIKRILPTAKRYGIKVTQIRDSYEFYGNEKALTDFMNELYGGD